MKAPGTILVVDDDPEIRAALAGFLTGEGYEVLTSADGDAALRLLQHVAAPALILTDLMMPHMSGIDFWEQLKQVTPDVPVIAMSAAPRQSPQGLRILNKPIDIDGLMALVLEHCGHGTPRTG